MEIAPGVRAEAWRSLELGPRDGRDWQRARAIFRARINDRYLTPGDRLIAAEQRRTPKRRRFGFAVLALDCLLIETLGAFVEGLTDTRRQSGRVFTGFLRSQQPFDASFTTKELADQCYEEFRCGILHQAEIKGQSRVWSVGPLLRMDGAMMTINRNAFHAGLRASFANYLADLADPGNTVLRDHFRKKMDFIARITD